jgi:hypothetical protein
MFEIIARVRAAMSERPCSLFVHADGTRAQSCRQPTIRCSSVVLDLAVELDVPIVPVRFTGGLPVEPIDGKAELPFGHGRQDYWIGAAIAPAELRSMGLRDRVDRVVDAINTLGMANQVEVPLAGHPDLAQRVDQWRRQRGTEEVWAAAWQILERNDDVSPQTEMLRAAAANGHYRSDGTPEGDWLAEIGTLLLGPARPAVVAEAAGPPIDGAVSRTTFTVSRQSHPQFADHAIGGVPVLPFAYALEGLARAAIAHASPLQLVELGGVRVLKGIELPDFSAGSATEYLVTTRRESTSTDHATLSLELVDASTGRRHYRCAALLARSPATDAEVGGKTGSSPESAGVAPYGGGVLFHGPQFQVVESVGPASTTGLVATIAGVASRHWPAEHWVSDPALLDGALQLALLWTERLLGRASLPTAVGAVRWLGGPTAVSCTAVLTGRSATSTKVDCDVLLTDHSGAAVAEVLGIETHLLTSGA